MNPTSGGVELTPEVIYRLAAEAEAGYDVDRLRQIGPNVKRELPRSMTTVTAMRVWPARPEDGDVCTYFVRMFGDDAEISHVHTGNPGDMWWVALPITTPKHPEEFRPTYDPSLADVACARCLPMAIYTLSQAWAEANMDPEQ